MQSGALSCSIGCTQLFNRVHSPCNFCLQRNNLFHVQKKCWLFFFMFLFVADRPFCPSCCSWLTKSPAVSEPMNSGCADRHNSLSALPSAPAAVPTLTSASWHTAAWLSARPQPRETAERAVLFRYFPYLSNKIEPKVVIVSWKECVLCNKKERFYCILCEFHTSLVGFLIIFVYLCNRILQRVQDILLNNLTITTARQRANSYIGTALIGAQHSRI